MNIYIDADAVPNAIKTIICKAAIRVNCQAVFVANRPIQLIKHPNIKMHCVSQGFDKADNYITDQVTKNDLVITADIPLASDALSKQAAALHPRGTHFTQDTIQQRLSVRNYLEELRGSGVHTGGPKVQNKKDVMLFANALDRYLQKYSQS